MLLVISFEAGGRKKEKQGRNTEETLKRKARDEVSVGEDGRQPRAGREKESQITDRFTTLFPTGMFK